MSVDYTARLRSVESVSRCGSGRTRLESLAVPATPQEFERGLRAACDDAYERSLTLANPLTKLVDGTMTREDARRFWGPRWYGVLLLTQHILPGVLRRCPDFDVRRGAVAGDPRSSTAMATSEQAHLTHYRRFLAALDIPPDQCPNHLPRDRPDLEAAARAIDNQSWLELLGRLLGRETVGPKVFPIVEQLLGSRLGLSSEALTWFRAHVGQDEEDADVLFRIARRYGTTDDSQAAIMRALQGWFDDSPYCYRLGPHQLPLHVM